MGDKANPSSPTNLPCVGNGVYMKGHYTCITYAPDCVPLAADSFLQWHGARGRMHAAAVALFIFFIHYLN